MPKGDRIGDLVAGAIQRLRLKLLDLSNRNRLLNFKFSSTSRKFVRVVDEIPDLLFEKLTAESASARRLYFSPLPEPPAGRLPNPTQGQLISQAPDAEPGLANRHAYRNDSRQSIDLEAWARSNGIDPSFELKPRSTGARGHEDNKIQLLLLPTAMEKKLAGLREDARLSNEELGLSTLFAAFGFLEWYESDTSEQALFAPLLLLPIEIDRDLRDHRYRYFVSAGDGSEPTYNVSLKERLSRDFGIALPSIGEEETPESYLASISRAIRSQKRWSIHRYVVIGHFSFSRLVMYEDLGPSRWAPDGIEGHELVRTLLAGSESVNGEVYASEFDVDDENIEKHVPVLITDADSSQFSAIVDAMQGRSFALKGPPGTGKSQTITNLIGAALAAGKRVLFVAEKQAALEVVSKRLREAGLAPFILELHSTKANKKRVLESFGERLSLKPRLLGADLAGTLNALRDTRTQLTAYVNALNIPIGESSLSLHDVYWLEQQVRRSLPPAAVQVAKALERSSSANLSRHAHGENTMLVDEFVAAYRRCADGSSITQHPLFGIDKPGEGPDAVETLRSVLVPWARGYEALEVAIAETERKVNGRLPRSIMLLERLAIGIEALGHTSADLDTSVLSKCQSEAYLDALSIHANKLRQLYLRWKDHHAILRDPQLVASASTQHADAAKNLLEALSALGISDGPLAEVVATLNDREDECVSDAKLVAALQRFLSSGGISVAVGRNELTEWAEALQVLRKTPSAILGLVSEQLKLPDAATKIEELSEKAAVIRASLAECEAESRFVLSDDPAAIATAAETLKHTNPVLGMLQPSYRAAKRLYQSKSRKVWSGRQRAAADLDKWAAILGAAQTFGQDRVLAQYAGDAATGILTNFDNLKDAVAYISDVNRRWPVLDEEGAQINGLLTSGNAQLLQSLVAGLPANASDRMGALARKLKGRSKRSAQEYLSERGELIAGALVNGNALLTIETVQAVTVKSLRTALGDLVETMAVQADLEEASRALGRHVSMPPVEGQVAALECIVRVASTVREMTLSDELRARMLSEELSHVVALIRADLPTLMSKVTNVAAEENRCISLLGVDVERFVGNAEIQSLETNAVHSRLRMALSVSDDNADDWIRYREVFHRCQEAGLAATVIALSEERAAPEQLNAIHRLSYLRGLIRWAAERYPKLPKWSGEHLDGLRARLTQLDKEYIQLGRRALVSRLSCAPVPEGVGQGAAGDRTERALIQHEVEKQRRHIPIRDLLFRAAGASRALKPCFMMSPASVAQFLPAQGAHFDIVVIDEASQMRPEEALGSLGRARQAVIVGDPMQLPPTSFFDSSSDTEEVEDESQLDVDTESVLDLGLSCLRPSRDLRWHYRSRHHSLIAFSNRQFYGDRLIVFPSPFPPRDELGVQLVAVERGLYQSSLNVPEAEQVVKVVQNLIAQNPRVSIGIVAMNQPQRDLLAETFDRLFADNEALESYRANWANSLEPFFVKNLENVQGDERDVIVVSTVYGPASDGGPVYQRFGPINSAVGHRRLNVLFTRAKERVVIVSSLRPEDIQVQPGSGPGVSALKSYLEFARSGRLDIGNVTGASADSPFEAEVAEELVRLGYSVEPQVGVAGFFIDLAVRHPQDRDHFIVGIECDGANYHSARSARDRDRLREEILRRLGWKLYRIWSTDWFRSRGKEVAKLRDHLTTLVGAK